MKVLIVNKMLYINTIKGENKMIQINSLDELKNILKPLLKYKKTTLEKDNIYLTEEEIFSYFADKRWKKGTNLHLCDIVDDVLNIEIEKSEVFNK